MIRPLATFGARLVRRFACTTTLSLNACSMSVSNDICKVIASHLKGGDVVQLIGKVGAGKTATARGIIRALVKNDDEVVQSPTFSLALSYQYAYRQAAARAARLLSRSPPHRLRRLVKTSAILGELGPMIGAHDSVCLIEWGVDMFPHRSALHVRIDDDLSGIQGINDDSEIRVLHISAFDTTRWSSLMTDLAEFGAKQPKGHLAYK